MKFPTPLEPYRWMIEIAAAVILVTTLSVMWNNHNVEQQRLGAQAILQADQKARDEQKQQDAAKFAAAGETHAKEMGDIAAYNFDAGQSSVVCHNRTPRGNVPATVVHGDTGAASAVVPGDVEVHHDITRPLQLLARRADKLSADARQLSSEAH